MDNEKENRIAVVDSNKCKTNKCFLECKKKMSGQSNRKIYVSK